jgi:ribosome biogenesis protein MAK21
MLSLLFFRVMAFIKRLALCSLQSSAPIAAGLAFLISEVCHARPTLLEMLKCTEDNLSKARSGSMASANDEEDADEGGDADDDESNGKGSATDRLGNFEASKREPSFAVSSTPALWEMAMLQNHFHPSVKSFSETLLKPPHKIAYSGDPTTDFSLTSFLNRFAYKNPKKQATDSKKHVQAPEEEPINTYEFIHQKASQIAPDKMFFYKFFGEKEKLKQEGKIRDRSRKKKGLMEDGDGGDGYDGEGSDDEQEIDMFATKLAEDMIKGAKGGMDDPDMDDISDDDMDDEEDDEDEEGDDMDFSEDDDDDMEDDDDEEGGRSRPRFGKDTFDEVSDDDDDDIDFDEGLDSRPTKKGKAVPEKDRNVDKKKASKSKSKADDSDDEDGDDGYQLMAYGDEDEDEGVDAGDDDDDDSVADEDEDEDEDDVSGDDDGDHGEGDDDDDEDDLDLILAGDDEGPVSSKRKGKDFAEPKGKKAKGAKGDSDFASADDYESMMDEILEKVNSQDAGGGASSGSGGAGGAKKGANSGKQKDKRKGRK